MVNTAAFFCNMHFCFLSGVNFSVLFHQPYLVQVFLRFTDVSFPDYCTVVLLWHYLTANKLHNVYSIPLPYKCYTF